MTDRKIANVAAVSVFAVLLLALVLPMGESGRIAAAILLLPAALLIPLFLPKRNSLSINKTQVLLIITVTALVCVMACYLTGMRFGFYRNPYRLTVGNFFRFFLPIAVIIVTTEIVRFVMVSQKNTCSEILCYFSCVIAEMLICANLPAVTSFSSFMDLAAGAFFPAITANGLYHYLSKRYGLYPNLVYRCLTTLYGYTFSVVPGIPDSLLNFFKLLLPIAIYYFIDFLYEKKRRYALQKTSRFSRVISRVLTSVALVIMFGTVMLVSNQFRFGALVIATESMTGELNKGDVAIFERYEEQFIPEGQVIAFERNNSAIVHRVVDIQIINGSARYYTKGDTNEAPDTGYVTKAEIIGLVNHKVPFLGFPTLWLRSLFAR